VYDLVQMKIRAATIIAAERGEVFRFFVDFPESAKVLHSAFKTEFITPHTTGLGAEWTQYEEDPESPVIAHHKVIAFNEPQSYTMTSDDQHAFETMEFTFTPSGNGTAVSFVLTIDAKGFLVKVATGLFGFVIRNYMKQDLARIKAAIEAERVLGT
jgi:Polyketide cyclase / dehydrase and lipid transport